ncbi:MAG: hypothetical protein D6688_03905 [Alphaproteobacteria bacterium]|nr:MAG: hypothetical protein D6688_03905 [Alphaproteobacteria bacterium]
MGVTAWNIASFAFAAIAILLPDLKTVQASWWLQEELLWSISMLVVFFPVFLVLHLWIAGRAAADPTHRLSLAARRFAYVALFLAAVAILVVLAVTIYTFLSGEVTERFMLKALTVAIVAGVVFMYFQQSLRSEASRRWPSPVIALSVMVVLVVGVDWWITDSPHSRQILKRDETRLHDLSALAPFVRCVAQRNNNRLPEKLPIRPEDAPGCGAQDLRFSDPYTGKPYLYEKIDDRTFRLCADFERVTMVSPFDTETLGIRFDGVRGCIVALYVSR